MRKTIALVALALMGCSGAGGSGGEAESVATGPERILFRDIEENVMFGASCAFAPTGGGNAAIAIAMQEGGFIKLGGEIVELAPVSDDQPLGPPAMEFSGDAYSLSLSLDGDSARTREDGGAEYDAQLQIKATDGSMTYEADGLAQCGA